MSSGSIKLHRDEARKLNNAEFIRRLHARRPQAKQEYDARVVEFALRRDPVAEAPGELRPEAIGARPNVVELVNETIVFEERPVLFVTNDWVDTENVTRKGPEADELIGDLTASRAKLEPVMPLVGRIDVVGFPNIDYVGTGWLVDTDIVVSKTAPGRRRIRSCEWQGSALAPQS